VDFARKVWRSDGALGRRLFLGGSAGSADEAYTVVGVVGAVKQASLAEAGGSGAVYYPYSGRFDRSIYLVGRASVAPETLVPIVRGVIRRIDPELPINNARAMASRVDDSLAVQRSPAIVSAVFSSVALLLTSLGTYGVLSYAVATRRREIGVRLALGAQPAQVRRQFVGVGLRLLGGGIAAGLAGSWAAGRALQSALAGIPQAPVASMGLATALMSIVCLAACLAPARRAARIPAIESLIADR